MGNLFWQFTSQFNQELLYKFELYIYMDILYY